MSTLACLDARLRRKLDGHVVSWSQDDAHDVRDLLLFVKAVKRSMNGSPAGFREVRDRLAELEAEA